MNKVSIYEGIIIGAVGGAFAGIFIWFMGLIWGKIIDGCDRRKVRIWLEKNTALKAPAENFMRSTRAIASHNNFTEDRVSYLCSSSTKITLSTADLKVNL